MSDLIAAGRADPWDEDMDQVLAMLSYSVYGGRANAGQKTHRERQKAAPEAGTGVVVTVDLKYVDPDFKVTGTMSLDNGDQHYINTDPRGKPAQKTKGQLFTLKVQVDTSVSRSAGTPLLAYDQGKQLHTFIFNSLACVTSSSGANGYYEIDELVRSRGDPCGRPWGCKAYFEACVTGTGTLRIMLGKLLPNPGW